MGGPLVVGRLLAFRWKGENGEFGDRGIVRIIRERLGEGVFIGVVRFGESRDEIDVEAQRGLAVFPALLEGGGIQERVELRQGSGRGGIVPFYIDIYFHIK